MAVAEQSIATEYPTETLALLPDEVVTLEGEALSELEEAATALAAVRETLGSKFTTLVHSTEGDALEDQPEIIAHGGEPETFQGLHARAIQFSLETVARNPASDYQLPARQILRHLLPTDSLLENLEKILIVTSWGDLATAYRAVSEFPEQDARLNTDRERVLDKLWRMIGIVTPGEERTIFYGHAEAEVIYRALVKSALRDKTHGDALSADLLKTSEQVVRRIG